MSELIKSDYSALSFNPFDKIGKEWMLITAGNKTGFNTMTASWGGMGVLWNKNVVYIFIRPQRHTLNFIDNSEYFSLSFFSEEYKKAHLLCGTKSGRDCDKVKETGLTPIFDENAPYFKEAETVLICKKLYRQQLSPDSVIDEKIFKEYNNDYHFAFVGEITEVLKR